MGADNFLGNNFDADSARYDRQNRLNPPDFAPGQGSSDDLFSSSFEQSVSGGDMFSSFSQSSQQNPSIDIFGGAGGGTAGTFNTGNVFNGSTFGQQGQQQTSEVKSDEDKIFDFIINASKGASNFIKDMYSSSKELTPKYWSLYGKNSLYTSLVVSVLGLLIKIFGVSFGLDMIIGGLISGSIGIIFLMFNVEKSKDFSSPYSDESESTNNNSNDEQIQDSNNNFGFDNFDNDNSGEFDNMGFDQAPSDFGNFDDDQDEFGAYDNDEDDDYEDFDFDEASLEPVSADGEDIEKALDEFQVVDRGMYTRQYLYENFVKVLPNLHANFSDVKDYDEDSEVFLSWDESLREAASVSGCKEDDLPDLLELQETLLTIKVTCSRPKSLKTDLLAKELANMYAYKDGEFNDKVYAVADTVGAKCIITIYTGETALVSLKDMYAHIKDDILDSKNYIPVVLGIDQSGKVIWCDFKKIESCIVAGMPRSGKSWLVQAILTQMCAFCSPKELNIYIIDPKDSTSDFKRFTLPHVKKFATRYKSEQGVIVNPNGVDMLTTLSQIVRVEAPRRKKLIGDAKCVNIWDFRKKCPDVDLPLLYVVIDEAVTIAEDMDKDDKKEYQSYMTQLITQFPNLGIRAFLIPHVVKDQIIKKTATDSVKCRISVKGSPDHIESSTGTKPKDFKYKLCNVGDMAVNIPDIKQQTMFIHGVALTDDNEKNADVFDYLRRVWAKLEPDEVSNSVSVNADDEKFNEKLLKSLDDLDDNEDLGLLEDPFVDSKDSYNNSVINESDNDFLQDFR